MKLSRKLPGDQREKKEAEGVEEKKNVVKIENPNDRAMIRNGLQQ